MLCFKPTFSLSTFTFIGRPRQPPRLLASGVLPGAPRWRRQARRVDERPLPVDSADHGARVRGEGRALSVMKRDKSIAWRRVDPSSLDLRGTKVAVVGGTGGLGRAISRRLASRGASVTVVGQTFRDSGVPGIEFVKADLSLMREAERVAKTLPAEKLDLV